MSPASGVLNVVFLELGTKVSLGQEILGCGALGVTFCGFFFFLRVVPREFFKMIQQWIMSTNTEVEKSTMRLNEEVSGSK